MSDRNQAMQELRALVATYLEGSDDAARAQQLLDVVDSDVDSNAPSTATSSNIPEDDARRMFGCTAMSLDACLAGKTPRDIAAYAAGTLSNAQELIQCDKYENGVEWTVADRDANTIRQLINIAKYAINKAVPK